MIYKYVLRNVTWKKMYSEKKYILIPYLRHLIFFSALIGVCQDFSHLSPINLKVSLNL